MKLHPEIVPCGHISPRPRIQIGQPDAMPATPVVITALDEMAEFARNIERQRIWDALIATAKGSNVGEGE